MAGAAVTLVYAKSSFAFLDKLFTLVRPQNKLENIYFITNSLKRLAASKARVRSKS